MPLQRVVKQVRVSSPEKITRKVPDEGPSEEGESGLVKEAAVAHGRQKQEGWFREQTPRFTVSDVIGVCLDE